MKIFTHAALGFLTLGSMLQWTGCASNPVSRSHSESVLHSSGDHPATNDPQTHGLTREEAMFRAKWVGGVSYQLWFDLDEEHEDFQGRTVIQFQIKGHNETIPSGLFLDFKNEKDSRGVLSLRINERSFSIAEISEFFQKHRLLLPPAALVSGANRVEISYEQKFSRDGSGLHRFVDPEDKNIYLYTDLEPYDARRVFPCFDQPDLKASYELTVLAPESWEVIANSAERNRGTVDGKLNWEFPPTPVFSTYLFALHAGPYHSWKDNFEGIPLRLFARKTLAPHVAAQEWFHITKTGLAYFPLQFEYPYPYAKYDQLIVPEFNAGAMENVGAVTFAERFVFRGTPTSEQLRSRASVILHEMAHMWFGNLVTMRWWNGLWLNESFATFAANLAMAETKLIPNTWESFLSRSKASAYLEDQWVTTHPIETSVANTSEAFSNFDSITYGKGAAVLRQLMAILGPDDFKEGLSRYFLRHALKNTTLADFLKALTEASGEDLQEWQRVWLQTAGVNTLRAKWSCESGKISQFSVLQTATPDWPTLRPHRIQIALYTKASGLPSTVLTARIVGSETAISDATGKSCPIFVDPNHEDWTYARTEWDEVSLGALKTHLSTLSSPLTRMSVWQSLWEMLRTQNLGPDEWLELAINHLPKETESVITTWVIRQTLSRTHSTPSVARYLTLQMPHHRDLLDRWEKLTHQEFLHSLTQSSASKKRGLALVWWNGWMAALSTQTAPAALDLLKGKNKLAHFTLDQDRRWQILQALAAIDYPGTEEWIKEEKNRDPSETGSKEAILAEARLSGQRATWEDRMLGLSLVDGAPIKSSVMRKAAGAFNLLGRETETRHWMPRYFQKIPHLATLNDESFASRFSEMLFPYLCDASTIIQAHALLKNEKNLPVSVKRALQVAAQEEGICVGIRGTVRSQ